jgi:anti-sigma factor RsiW
MIRMNPISDDDLVLHHYCDGLEPEQFARIDAALAASPDLRARRDALLRTLAAMDSTPAPQPDADFEERLWRRLEPHLSLRVSQPPRRAWSGRLRAWLTPPTLAWAGACAIALAVGVGFLAGRQTAPEPDAVAQARADESAMRVLDAYVAAHLRATEGVLVTASNSDSVGVLDGNRQLAASLVDANRLYARAAARSGNAQLSEFLRQLEPVLISLANPPASSNIKGNEGLRDYLHATDLLFQVRATKARLDHNGNRRT